LIISSRIEKSMAQIKTSPRFHDLPVSRVSPEAAGAVAISFAVPAPLRETFNYEPGQFLTLRAQIDGEDVRRSYSICSATARYRESGELEVGIRPMQGGLFSNWAATHVKVGDVLPVMPPDGRFVSKRPRAVHRVGFAAGSGITPILSIIATSLQEQENSKFTLVYGNRSMASVMFNEALQDLKDRYPDRLTLIHILSRQAQEVDLLRDRIDAAKVRALVAALLPAQSMDEVFICGPEAMIEATESALIECAVPARNIHTERFTSPRLEATPKSQRQVVASLTPNNVTGGIALQVTLDGKQHALHMRADERVLDVALAAGLDLPYSCKAGVCCTCRAKVTAGSVAMERNFTLEHWEMDKGFVLTCQARPTTPEVSINFDDR
jgi:ring-1,2-phenylacetyl-CoA epoxidase subunit PaaE